MTTELVRIVRGSVAGGKRSVAGGRRSVAGARRSMAGARRQRAGVGWVLARARAVGEQGMTTAEYAVGTMAAVAFAGLLLAVVKSGPVKNALSQVIVAALGSGS